MDHFQNKQINSNAILQFQIYFSFPEEFQFIQPRIAFLFFLIFVSYTYIQACNRSL